MSPESVVNQANEGIGFDNDLYLETQLSVFHERLDSMPDADIVIEFGGKPFGDHHAARVLPGYNIDNKATIIRRLQDECNSKIAMVVNARDIFNPPDGRTLQGRVRGDSGLRYELETMRLIKEAREIHGINVDDVVIAVMPRSMSRFNKNVINYFSEEVYSQLHTEPKVCYEIPGYPDIDCLSDAIIFDAFNDNDTIVEPDRNLVLLSPGGGSGKFGVAMSEIYKKLSLGHPVGFAKFETFPVFRLAPDHPINLAFIAATADLGNRLVNLEQGTNYDKDDENFRLLSQLIHQMPDSAGYISSMGSQFDFSVNTIESGITDEQIVLKASHREIISRLLRYTQEYVTGNEKLSTVRSTAKIAGQCAVYLSEHA
jgi:uncharacterized protein (UPF0371 family)